MDAIDLSSQEGLRAACARAEDTHRERKQSRDWQLRVEKYLAWVASCDEEERASEKFHQELWENNPISAVGQGNVPVGDAISDRGFRQWFAKRSLETLPKESSAAVAFLTDFYQEILKRIRKLNPGRTPALKTFRVLAALFPTHFTSVTHRHRMHLLYTAIGGKRSGNPVEHHVFVTERLNEVMGPVAPRDQAWRLTMPWYLVTDFVQLAGSEEEKTTNLGDVAGEEQLLPLPAARRRKGLTAIGGYFPALLLALEIIKDGITREELLDYLRNEFPDHKESTLKIIINILRAELAVIAGKDDRYWLTPVGKDVLESTEASALGDWLLTRILGVDHVLVALSAESLSKDELIALLQRVHPGWTSDYAPGALLAWLTSFKAIERTKNGFALTELGQDWVARIHWKPEFLDAEPEIEGEPPENNVSATVQVTLPPLTDIIKKLKISGESERRAVTSLHLGLWAPVRRHFAVLTGISGSGKTRLASRYAEALTGTTANGAQSRIHIEAVQPAWYDPAPILGYVSPLKKDSYTRTAFLNFLLRVSVDSQNPYVLVLDEMNLSHPEQYLAPLLSAMESGGHIRLHAEGERLDGVPGSILYPSNLAIIGTINMDETTHGLSDKVLDRAHTMDFSFVDIQAYPGWATSRLAPALQKQATELLVDLSDALRPARLHFGWRVVDDVVRYLEFGTGVQPAPEAAELLDTVVFSKVLPKLRGEDSDTFREVLRNVAIVLERHHLTACKDCVAGLERDLHHTGSARFWR